LFSYLHRFHAGNFADVHKHLGLMALLTQLQQKTSPLVVLDSHAGEGHYALSAAECQKNAEYRLGAWPLFHSTPGPRLVRQYVQLLHNFNREPSLQHYPGSPAIIQAQLRTQDRAILVEGHPQSSLQLRKNFAKNPQLHIHQRDAIEALGALLPFKVPRGLIFIDPSYELKSDYQLIVAALKKAYACFSTGIYGLWYPILPAAPHQGMLTAIKALGLPKVWHCEWYPYPQQSSNLIGSGLLVINLPWQLDQTLTENFNWLNTHVYPAGHFSAQWYSGCA
jgi:23S rRNA (adenine2030-N6)-methyltransferase